MRPLLLSVVAVRCLRCVGLTLKLLGASCDERRQSLRVSHACSAEPPGKASSVEANEVVDGRREDARCPAHFQRAVGGGHIQVRQLHCFNHTSTYIVCQSAKVQLSNCHVLPGLLSRCSGPVGIAVTLFRGAVMFFRASKEKNSYKGIQRAPGRAERSLAVPPAGAGFGWAGWQRMRDCSERHCLSRMGIGHEHLVR